jgi:hypothetical protein
LCSFRNDKYSADLVVFAIKIAMIDSILFRPEIRSLPVQLSPHLQEHKSAHCLSEAELQKDHQSGKTTLP